MRIKSRVTGTGIETGRGALGSYHTEVHETESVFARERNRNRASSGT